MLKGLLVGLKKASDATAVRKAATKARKAVRENSKIKGSEEKDALAEISAMANKLIESKTKKVYDGKKKATPESVKGAVKGERSKARADAAKASSKTGKDGTQKPVGKDGKEAAAGRLGRSGASDQADYEVELGKAGTVESGKKSVPSFADMETSNKNRLKRNKKVAELETKEEKGTITAEEKKDLDNLNAASKRQDIARTRKGSAERSVASRKDKGISLAGEGGKIKVGAKAKYKDSELIGSNTNGIVRDTGEILGNPTPNQMDMAIRNLEARSRLTQEAKRNLAKLKRMSKSDRQDASLRRMERRLKDTGKDKPRNFKRGGLAQPNANQTGLKKLPTAVRNKMGYMKRGGKVTKGHVDMRKGGLFR